MPKILDSGVKKIMKTGKSKEQAYAIITSTLKKAKIIDSKGNLTELGKKRNAMTPKQREKTPLAKTKQLVRMSKSKSKKAQGKK